MFTPFTETNDKWKNYSAGPDKTMSSFLNSFKNGHNGDSKYYNMIEFINAVNIYIRTRTEESAHLINRHLQLLGVTIDYSIFDPNTSVVCEFFVSLHELLTCLEPRSTLAWCCINVLSVACRNPSARNQLIHTYQFIPALSRLLGDHLNNDKKINLLTVMQELSCGIKISWQIPHLLHLMSTLIRWIEKDQENEQITMLSLGVLVNLCYKNLPAIYTLSKCVDIKKFIKTCTTLKGHKMEVNVCKLLIILDYVHGVVPKEVFVKLINVTFKSVREALKIRDPILLRHVVEFYLDVKEQNERTDVNNFEVFNEKYLNYVEDVEQLMDVVDNNATNAAGDASQHDPECMSLIFKFLHTLIELKLPKLLPIYTRFTQLGLRWIQTDFASSEALSVLKTISLTPNLEDETIFDQLLCALPIFCANLQSVEDDMIMNIDQCNRLCSVMELLRALVLVQRTREKVLLALNEQMVCQIFVPLIGSQSPRGKAEDANNCTKEAIALYVHTLVLLKELAMYNPAWVNPLGTLLQHRQIHAILAEALYSGTQDIKSLILNMAASTLFPGKQVGAAMYELYPFTKFAPQNVNNSNMRTNFMCYPVMSIAQSEKLDATIEMLKDACTQKNIVNTSTSEVMELYEYKIATMSHAERAAMASVEAASQHCTHLQHQTAQLTAEISRIRQLFIHTQQTCEDLSKSNNGLQTHNSELISCLEVEKAKYKRTQSQLEQKQKLLVETESHMEVLSKRIKEKETENVGLVEQNEKFKGYVLKLEENLKRQEKNCERKDEIIRKVNAAAEDLKTQTGKLEKELHKTEALLKSRVVELERVNSELVEKSQLIDAISRHLERRK